VAVIAAFIAYYWLPISGEIGSQARPQTVQADAEIPPRAEPGAQRADLLPSRAADSQGIYAGSVTVWSTSA
jgi:hypothetical protein